MKTTLFWFRRDLRLTDNTALTEALQGPYPVRCLFIFDQQILDSLNRDDARVTFIYQQLQSLNDALKSFGATLHIYFGNPISIWKELAESEETAMVFTNRDYEPYALKRDAQIAQILNAKGIPFNTYKDHVIFEPEDILKDDGKPYTIFTPYSKRWLAKLNGILPSPFQTEKFANNFLKEAFKPLLPLENYGFQISSLPFPPSALNLDVVKNYAQNRDIPALAGTTRLSVHLRFGTVSIRNLVSEAMQHSEKWLGELIWREFYQSIIYHFPQVVTKAFKPEYDRIDWRNNETEFEAWKIGQTGYPLVDAGMRELLATGFMHNRVRMVVASFLSKHLLIDWRWGEAWFAEQLLDFELASNNGGWQWAAGCGCDAAPYFRIFNPRLQTEKFDPNLTYIKKWVPELNSFNYPQPIVNHEMARARVLEAYKKALDGR